MGVNGYTGVNWSTTTNTNDYVRYNSAAQLPKFIAFKFTKWLEYGKSPYSRRNSTVR